MNKCMNCGAEYENGEKFCIDCGSKIVAVPETAAGKCATCGAELAAGSKFCSNCGAKAEAPMVQETPVIVASPPSLNCRSNRKCYLSRPPRLGQ